MENPGLLFLKDMLYWSSSAGGWLRSRSPGPLLLHYRTEDGKKWGKEDVSGCEEADYDTRGDLSKMI